MARSGLRRYPREILDSLLGRSASETGEAAIALEGRCEPDALAASWLGHATVLLRMGGMWILTDPVLFDRIGIRIGHRVIGLGRRRRAAVQPEDLPALDLLLVTHAHFDHLDRPSLSRLADRRTRVITARRTARLIPRGFGSVKELAWSRRIAIRGVCVSSLRPAHWGARRAFDRWRGYNSYLIESSEHRVLFTGDTAMTDAFDGLGTDERPLDLAIFGIGAYEPWQHQHATPEQVWEMFLRSGARALLPVHHSTFPLGDEHPDEPMERLLAVAGQHRTRIVGRELGELWVAPGHSGTPSPEG